VLSAARAATQSDFDQGLAAFERGAFGAAIESWTRAARAAEKARDPASQISALVRLGDAYAALGQYRQAVVSLDAALKIAETSGQQGRVPWILARLGSALIATGPPDAAETALRRALDMARASGDSGLAAGVLNELGNSLAMRKKTREAVTAYRDSIPLADQAGQPSVAIRARLNEAAALRRGNAAAEGRFALDDALERLGRENASRDAAFALVSVGIGYRELRVAVPAAGAEPLLRASEALTRGGAMAESLGDRRTVSYARGYLGTLYEDERRYDEALQLTREAIFAAQQVNAPESLYRWQWQAARLHRKMGNTDEALAAYRRALAISPEDARLHASVGWTLIELGRHVEAARELQAALRLDPSLQAERAYLTSRYGPDARIGPSPVSTR
jgi:tetratricopeptide (TPR) repeat protein